MSEWLLAKTVASRHKLARFLAPKLFGVSDAFYNVLSTVPRPMILFLKEYFGSSKVEGVEVGVAHGENAESILNTLEISKLWLVDPYEVYYENGAKLDFSMYLAEAKKRLNPYGNVEFVVASSVNASERFKANSLDFVYIDGNHNYESVSLDIKKYYPLVRAGGVIGGHDYSPLNKENVVYAVDEFVNTAGLRKYFYAVFPDWWIIKPKGEKQ